jgi:NitT/TauT family transport system substrate-binding protein
VYANQKPLGQIDAARMDSVQKFYVSEGIVSTAAAVNDLFTNQFIGTAR